MKETKKNYEAPHLTTVTFKMEQGFAPSTRTIGLPPAGTDPQQDGLNGINDYNVENADEWF